MNDTHGLPYWSELMTRDVPKARALYAEICGWSFEEVPMPDGTTYVLAMRDGTPVAGLMDISGSGETPDRPARWMTYFAVKDVDAAVAASVAQGSTLNGPIFDVPGTGRIAMLTDPTGAEVGLMTPEPMG